MRISINDSEFSIYSEAFEKAKAPDSNYIQADAAKDVLMRSNLPMTSLYKIWNLVDFESKGQLNCLQFVLALHLAKSAMSDKPIPDSLPPNIIAQLSLYNPGSRNNIFSPTALNNPKTFELNSFTASNPINSSSTAYLAQPTPSSQDDVDDLTKDFEKRFPDFNALQDPVSNLPNVVSEPRTATNSFSSSTQSTGIWKISSSEMKQYEAQFNALDRNYSGFVTGEDVKTTFLNLGIPVTELSQIWRLVDTTNDGNLCKRDYINALHILSKRLSGVPIPTTLPSEINQHDMLSFGESISDLRKELLKSDNAPRSASIPNLYSEIPVSSASKASNKYTQDTDLPRSSMRYASVSHSLTPTFRDTSYDQQKLSTFQSNSPFNVSRSSPANNNQDPHMSPSALENQILDMARQTLDLTGFSKKSFTSNDLIGFPDFENALIIKRQQLASKAFLMLTQLRRQREHYSSKIVEKEAEINESKAKLSVKPQTSRSPDASSKAAARIAERMKALTGADYDINLGLSPIEQPSSPSDASLVKLQAHKENLDSTNNKIAQIEQSFANMGLANLLNIKELSGILDHATYERWEKATNVSDKQTSDLIVQLAQVKGKTIDPSIIIPRVTVPAVNIFAETTKQGQYQNQLQSHSPFSNVTPVATSNTTSPLNPGRTSRVFGDIKSPEDRAQRLKRLAEEKFKERQRALGLILDDDEEYHPVKPMAPAVSTQPPKPAEQVKPLQSESPFATIVKTDKDTATDPTAKTNQRSIAVTSPGAGSGKIDQPSLPESVFQPNSNHMAKAESIYSNPFMKTPSTLVPVPVDTGSSVNQVQQENGIDITTGAVSTGHSSDLQGADTNAINDEKSQQFQSTAATLFSKLFGSPTEESKKFKGSLEISIDESDTSSESSFDFDESISENKKTPL